MREFHYDVLMEGQEPHIVLNLDLEQPAELTDFLGAFLALSSQYDSYMRQAHKDVAPESKIFVREIRPGSIEAVLVPLIPLIIDQMDKALIVEHFVRLYGSRLASYFQIGGRDKDASKGDLKDLMDAVSAIANDPNGTSTISAVEFVQGKATTRASIKFDTSQARTARESIESHKKEIDAVSAADSWDPFGAVVLTYQTLDFQIDAQASYAAKTEANDFEFGDVAWLDASLQYRLWPRELGAGVPGFLYGVLETNLVYRHKNQVGGGDDPNSGGLTVFILPGLQYVTKRWIVEAGIQIPVVQDLNGTALEKDYIIRAGFRLNF